MDQRTQVCIKCGIEKPVSTGFYKTRYTRKGTPYIPSECRQCLRAYLLARKKPCTDYVREFKLSRGCMDCGLKVDVPEVYDLDHRPDETKVEDVSQMVNRGNLAAVMAECAKCDVVCANCHRIRTVERTKAGIGFTAAFWDLRRGAAAKDAEAAAAEREPDLLSLLDTA